jgi:hypothetical protein
MNQFRIIQGVEVGEMPNEYWTDCPLSPGNFQNAGHRIKILQLALHVHEIRHLHATNRGHELLVCNHNAGRSNRILSVDVDEFFQDIGCGRTSCEVND